MLIDTTIQTNRALDEGLIYEEDTALFGGYLYNGATVSV